MHASDLSWTDFLKRKSNRKLYADFKEESCLRCVPFRSHVRLPFYIRRRKIYLPLLSARDITQRTRCQCARGVQENQKHREDRVTGDL